jgi:hypothetical protein
MRGSRRSKGSNFVGCMSRGSTNARADISRLRRVLITAHLGRRPTQRGVSALQAGTVDDASCKDGKEVIGKRRPRRARIFYFWKTGFSGHNIYGSVLTFLRASQQSRSDAETPFDVAARLRLPPRSLRVAGASRGDAGRKAARRKARAPSGQRNLMSKLF